MTGRWQTAAPRSWWAPGGWARPENGASRRPSSRTSSTRTMGWISEFLLASGCGWEGPAHRRRALRRLLDGESLVGCDSGEKLAFPGWPANLDFIRAAGRAETEVQHPLVLRQVGGS